MGTLKIRSSGDSSWITLGAAGAASTHEFIEESGSLSGTTGWSSTGFDTTYVEIKIMGYGISFSADNCSPLIQVQTDAGSWLSTGYDAGAGTYNNYDTFTSGFSVISAPTWDAAQTGWFTCILRRFSTTKDVWLQTGACHLTNGPGVTGDAHGYIDVGSGIGGIRVIPYVAAATIDSAGYISVWGIK